MKLILLVEDDLDVRLLLEHVLMAEGYTALALKTQPESRLAGGHELARILLLLGSRGSKDAQFFANQLITADRVLIRAGPNP